MRNKARLRVLLKMAAAEQEDATIFQPKVKRFQAIEQLFGFNEKEQQGDPKGVADNDGAQQRRPRTGDKGYELHPVAADNQTEDQAAAENEPEKMASLIPHQTEITPLMPSDGQQRLGPHAAIAEFIAKTRYRNVPNEYTAEEQRRLQRLKSGMSRSRARIIDARRRGRLEANTGIETV